MFGTTQKILNAYDNMDFYGLIVTGPQGIGKSTYAIKVLLEVYGSWRVAKNYIVFTMTDLITMLREAEEGERIKCILWDDAGIHAHKYMYFENRKLVQLLEAFIDVARTKIAGWIITVPNMDELAKPLKRSPGFRIGVVRQRSGDWRCVTVYEREFIPPRTYVRKAYRDVFRARLNDSIYTEYMEMRRMFYMIAEANLIKYINRYTEELLKR